LSFLELVEFQSPHVQLGRRARSLAVRLLGLLFIVGVVGGLPRVPAARADAAVHVSGHDQPERGLAVLGLGSTSEAAWPLARAIYADSALRPLALDEAHARVLAGESPGDAGPSELRDLAESRAAVRGDDAASRRLLASIAASLGVKGVVVVESADGSGGRPSARVFVASQSAYDPARYEPDPPAPVTWGNGTSVVVWRGAVEALHRAFAVSTVGNSALELRPSGPKATSTDHGTRPATTTTPGSDAGKSASRAFYQSPWFWAAAGAALFAAGAVYFATRSDGADNIQLQVQVPR